MGICYSMGDEERRIPNTTTRTEDDLEVERSQLVTRITEKVQSNQTRTFSYEELAAATDDFSADNCIGGGGFGQVYRAVLENSQVVAIKKLKHHNNEQKEKEFETEILTISRIRHQNLVTLVGFCIEGADRLLVYEFVPNNSLRTHLHGDNNPTLNWSTRVNIAIGSAKALSYLHEGCKPVIIHRDIKAENILLDEEFEPKIADFGLAKDFSNSISNIYTDPKGTVGYWAPESVRERKLNDKSDVFSFGIVLLELITGNLPIFSIGNDRENLAIWVAPQIKRALEVGDYESLIDPKLLSNYDKNEMGRMITCAAACVYKPAEHRPQMSQIVEALRGKLPSDSIWIDNDNNFFYKGAPYSLSPGVGENFGFDTEQSVDSHAPEISQEA